MLKKFALFKNFSKAISTQNLAKLEPIDNEKENQNLIKKVNLFLIKL